MLIVIVIIGILAVTLIPRLQLAQAKARNVARKADINQISVWVSMYKELEWAFPSNLWQVVSAWYIKSIPKDPRITSTDPCNGTWSPAWAVRQSSWFYFYAWNHLSRVWYNWYLYEHNNTHPPYFARISARMEQDGSKNSHADVAYDCSWLSSARGVHTTIAPNLLDLHRTRIVNGLTTQARFYVSLLE